jgi:hypothetical protein
VSDIPAHLEVELDAANYFRCGDVEALARALARGGYDRLRCSRRAAILQDNDWDTVARRSHAVLVRRSRDAVAAERAAAD